jgi:hypothetical protein
LLTAPPWTLALKCVATRAYLQTSRKIFRKVTSWKSSNWLIFRRKATACQPDIRWRRFVEEVMHNRTLAAVLIAGSVASLAGPAHAVPLSASLSLRDASTSEVQPVQWRRWGGWGGVGFGLAAGAIFGAALAAPYYSYGYGCYGCGYPAYSYGYGYGYPSYSYAYSRPYYSYAYSSPYYSYAYSSPYDSYAYAPAYYGYSSYPYYAYAPRIRYRAAFYRPWRRW